MTKLAGATIGFLVGGMLLHWPGAAAGLLVGLLFASVSQLHKRVEKLEARLAVPVVDKDARFAAEQSPPTPRRAPEPMPVVSTPSPVTLQVNVTPATSDVAANDTAESGIAAPPREPSQLEQAIDWLRTFFTSGNLVVKTGVIVLFFGVGFLLKYAVEHNKFPIELRLISTAIGALALLVIGWRLRAKRPGYALIIQGAGIGVLYLTVFAAAKLYQLLPLGLTFGVMVALVVLSAMLAVLQDARALAVFGAVGGFLAPVLLSTGAGNHVMLFSYYALLNLGIVGVAWFRAWRELNLIGFAFTFVIGALWGHRYYQPDFFASTEPFLVLFFAFYVGIAVLFAHRQPPQLRGYVDSAIVFGVPVVGFGLQAGLVRPYEYALAVSALVMSGVYIGLATALWHRKVPGMRILTEAFLALSVVFVSLAIPLALNGDWTAAAWALEGAAVVWIGVRQGRALARGFGLLLQLGAAFAFLGHGSGLGLLSHVHNLTAAATVSPPVLNASYLGTAIIGLAGLVTAFVLSRARGRLRDYEAPFEFIALAWGMVWWLVGGVHEISRFFDGQDEISLMLLFVAASALAATLIAHSLQWDALAMVPIGLFVIMLLTAASMIFDYPASHPFAGWGTPAWFAAFTAHYLALNRFEGRGPEAVTRLWHIGGFLLVVLLVTVEFIWVIERYGQIATAWKFAAWALVPTVIAMLLLRWGGHVRWRSVRFHREIGGLGLAPLLAVLAVWSLMALGERGESYPLPYLPVANPIDIVQLLVLALMLRWLFFCRAQSVPGFDGDGPRLLYYGIGALAMFWLSAAVGRTVHFWAGVPYTPHGLFGSVIYQAALTMTWSTIALLTMVLATRRVLRVMWFVGATLLAIVVIKLFLVDLTGIGTVARIISFVGVGVLMLVIGYFSPLPPRHTKEIPT
ncbi:MAG: DUF2339 domain-containing protein [Planctomycetota bacterium]